MWKVPSTTDEFILLSLEVTSSIPSTYILFTVVDSATHVIWCHWSSTNVLDVCVPVPSAPPYHFTYPLSKCIVYCAFTKLFIALFSLNTRPAVELLNQKENEYGFEGTLLISVPVEESMIIYSLLPLKVSP